MLVGDMTVARLGKLRMRFKEASEFRLRTQAPTRKCLQPFGDDRSNWLMPDQNAPASGTLLVLVTYRGVMDVKSRLHPRAHPRGGLLPILQPLMLSEGCSQGFGKNAVRVVTEIVVGRFNRSPRKIDQVFQVEVIADIARQTARVVDDDDDLQLAVLPHEGDHLIEARTLCQFSGHVVREGCNDLMIAMASVFLATDFL